MNDCLPVAAVGAVTAFFNPAARLVDIIPVVALPAMIFSVTSSDFDRLSTIGDFRPTISERIPESKARFYYDCAVCGAITYSAVTIHYAE